MTVGAEIRFYVVFIILNLFFRFSLVFMNIQIILFVPLTM